MRVLLCTPAHNALSKRAYHELVERGHTVQVQTISADSDLEIAIACHQPQLILSIFLKNPLPAHILNRLPVLCVRAENSTGRGPSGLDGQIEEKWQCLRIGFLEQNSTSVRQGQPLQCDTLLNVSHQHYYRHQAAQAAVQEIVDAIENQEHKSALPEWLTTALYSDASQLKGRLHHLLN